MREKISKLALLTLIPVIMSSCMTGGELQKLKRGITNELLGRHERIKKIKLTEEELCAVEKRGLNPEYITSCEPMMIPYKGYRILYKKPGKAPHLEYLRYCESQDTWKIGVKQRKRGVMFQVDFPF